MRIIKPKLPQPRLHSYNLGWHWVHFLIKQTLSLLLRLDPTNSTGEGVDWGHSTIPQPAGIVTVLARVDGGEAIYICSRLVTSSARTHFTTDVCLSQQLLRASSYSRGQTLNRKYTYALIFLNLLYSLCYMKSRPLRNILFSLLIVLWKFSGFHSLISVRYIVHNTGWGKRSPYLLIHVRYKSKLLINKKEMYSCICLTHRKIYHLSFLINNFIKTCSLQEKNHLVLYIKTLFSWYL